MDTAPRPELLVFDVNETLLDLTPLRTTVAAALVGRSELVGGWFRALLHYSLVHNATEDYVPFGDIAVAALRLTAARNAISLTEKAAREALAPLARLPPHPDVPTGLARLRDAGYRLAALTNGSMAGVTAQLAFADLEQYFEEQLSVESVRYFKPDRRVYAWAARRLGGDPSATLLVAAHPWDLMGARAAGWQTAFLHRPGTAWYPLAHPPDYQAPDLTALADRLTS